MRNPFRHECEFKPVAARPGHSEHERLSVFGPPGPLVAGTLVLYRCECGVLRTDMMHGVWTAAELGVPCGDYEAIDKLLSGGGK